MQTRVGLAKQHLASGSCLVGLGANMTSRCIIERGSHAGSYGSKVMRDFCSGTKTRKSTENARKRTEFTERRKPGGCILKRYNLLVVYIHMGFPQE